MCNLMGIYLPEGEKFTSKLRVLLFSTQVLASTKHGDGFGYYSSGPDGDFTRKTHLSALGSTYTEELLTLPENTRWVITHTRRASSGALKTPIKDASDEEWTEYYEAKQKFAHPFVERNVVVAHNGTLFPNDGIEFKMDSLYMAQSLSTKLATMGLKEALDKTFDDFRGGLMSLLLAVKEDGIFKPYILKGNKPLYRFTCENTGVTIFVTDDAFIRPYTLILNKTSKKYNFLAKGSLVKRGLWTPFADDPIYEKDYISYAAKNARSSLPLVRRTVNRKSTVPKSKTKFDKFCESGAGGLKKLVRITTWILTSLTYDEVRTLVDLTEGESVTVLELVEEKKYQEVRGLLK